MALLLFLFTLFDCLLVSMKRTPPLSPRFHPRSPQLSGLVILPMIIPCFPLHHHLPLFIPLLHLHLLLLLLLLPLTSPRRILPPPRRRSAVPRHPAVPPRTTTLLPHPLPTTTSTPTQRCTTPTPPRSPSPPRQATTSAGNTHIAR